METQTLGPESMVPVSGPTIARLRREAKLSQHRLGVAADVTGNTIARIERGFHANARLRTVRAIAEALGVELSVICVPWDDV